MSDPIPEIHACQPNKNMVNYFPFNPTGFPQGARKRVTSLPGMSGFCKSTAAISVLVFKWSGRASLKVLSPELQRVYMSVLKKHILTFNQA